MRYDRTRPDDGTKRPAARISTIMAVIVMLLVAGSVALMRGLSFSAPLHEIYAALSDGFFVSGILFGGIGLLVLISRTGFFDMLSYGLQGLMYLIPGLRPRKQETFYDYKTAREERRGKPSWQLALIGFTGILLAVLFLFLYHNTY